MVVDMRRLLPILALLCLGADSPPTPEALRASTKTLLAKWVISQREGDVPAYLSFFVGGR
jgi:hypothetical protein